jgi:hypothetical protein
MISALLASVGIPVLGKLVSSGLKAIDNPAAKAAADALDEVGGAVERGEIDPAQLAAANRHVETMTRIEAERDTALLAQVNRTMRTEALSEDAYVRRWRPTFGYAVALAWTAQTAGLTYAMVVTPAYAGELLAGMTHLSVIWGVALSVLGINVAKRSQDKAVAAGQLPQPGLLQRLAQPLVGGRSANG